MDVVDAIIDTETGGTRDCSLKGDSGERGCLQYMPATWKMQSRDIIGYVVQQNEVNERYVAWKTVMKDMKSGKTAGQIALKWNQGHSGTCRAGINSKGVKYDSCAYQKKFLANLSN